MSYAEMRTGKGDHAHIMEKGNIEMRPNGHLTLIRKCKKCEHTEEVRI